MANCGWNGRKNNRNACLFEWIASPMNMRFFPAQFHFLLAVREKEFNLIRSPLKSN